MTLDDLLKVFEQGFQAKLQSEDYPREAFAGPALKRAGIRAVVEALRDEADEYHTARAVVEMLSEILGSDDGVKVGTHGSPELDEDARKLKTLEGENARLKRLLANAHVDISVLKDLLGKS